MTEEELADPVMLVGEVVAAVFGELREARQTG